MNNSVLNRVTFRVWFPYVSFITFLVVILLIYFPNRQEQLLKQYEIQELQSLVNATALGISISLEIDDYRGVESTIEYLSKKEGVLFAAIILNNDNNQTVLSSYPEFLSLEQISELQEDAIVEEQVLNTSELDGIVRIAVSKQVLINRISKINTPIYIIVGVVFLVMMIVSYSIAKKYSDPIKAVTNYATKLENGDYSAHLNSISDINEIQILSTALESLCGTLEQQKKAEQEFANELESQIKNRTVELKNALEAKDEFLSTMSHEIRTPLNSIIGFSDLLMDRIEDGKSAKMVKSLNYSSKHLLSLINDILDFSKLSSESISLQSDSFDLREIIDQIKNQFSPILDEKNIELIVSIDSRIADYYCCDKVRINQLLNNLLSNAIKFTNTGYVELSIDLVDETESVHHLVFEIKDTGIGINKDDLERIQKPFIQANSSISNNYGGTGLGLSIVNKLLNLFDSKLEIKSEVGIGSVFSFELLLKTDLKTSQVKTDKVLNSKVDITPLEVLYVDDMTMNLYLFEEIVKDMNVNLETCLTAKEAFTLCEEKNYDLILMDIRMPEIDGVAAFKHIREHSKMNLKTPIIAFTANVELLDSENYLKMGFHSHLSKPITRKKIQDELNSIRQNEVKV